MSPARRRVSSGVPFEQAVGYSRAVAAVDVHPLTKMKSPAATSMVQVAALIDPRLLVEIEVVAHREFSPDEDEAEPDESEIPPDAIRLDEPSADDSI